MCLGLIGKISLNTDIHVCVLVEDVDVCTMRGCHCATVPIIFNVVVPVGCGNGWATVISIEETSSVLSPLHFLRRCSRNRPSTAFISSSVFPISDFTELFEVHFSVTLSY